MGKSRPLLSVYIAAVLLCCSEICHADGNVGCLFSQTLCLSNEWCYDDFAFGKCLPIYGDVAEEDKFSYSMTKNDLEKFENELQHLVELGYHWEHAYTQCVIQAMLQAARYGYSIDTNICDSLTDYNALSVSSENVESGDQRDLAFVKFTPNDNLRNSDFADEVYLPSQFLDGPVISPDNENQNLEWDNSVSKFGISPEETDYVHPPIIDGLRSMVPTNIKSTNDYQKYKNLVDLIRNEEVSTNLNSAEKAEISQLLRKYDNVSPASNFKENLLRVAKKRAFLPDNSNGIGIVEFPTVEEYNDFDNDKQTEENEAAAGETFDENYNIGYLPTSEFLTENRMNLKYFQSLPSYMNNPESNAIPESRIYVDEDDPEIFKVDSGSGEFNPQDIFDNIDGNVAIEGSIGNNPIARNYGSNKVANLLRYWAEKSAKVKNGKGKDFSAVYTEGGLVFPLDKDMKSNTELQELMSNYDWGFKRPERLDVKKPGPHFDVKTTNNDDNETNTTVIKDVSPNSAKRAQEYSENYNNEGYDVDTSYAYVVFKDSLSTWKEGAQIVHAIEELLKLEPSAFTHPRVDRNEVTFRVNKNNRGFTARDVVKHIDEVKNELQNRLGIVVISEGLGDVNKYPAVMKRMPDSWQWADWKEWGWGEWGILIAIAVLVIISIVTLILVIRRNARLRSKLQGLAADTDTEATQHYQDLCRARMSGKQQQAGSGGYSILDSGPTSGQRVTSLSRDSDGNSPSNRSSTSSWSEEPALTNMDISTGHMVLAYMEDHLKNKDRLEQEWEALCAYDAEPCTTLAATSTENIKKNRYPDVLPYDHARVTLNQLTNHVASDYINASTITDHDPRNPAYIATQGPLPNTTPDFWQMVWEQGSVVMVMLTRLTENGTVLCHRYWSEEGSALYHIYEVHLVSEHIWCDDYLVRSFYLKNIKTGETRTVTQFHFLSWPENGVPSSTKALLEFRRKVNKSYRGRSCPIVVHCSDGASRTGTYCLIDMVLNRMAKGAKEIDIAATLEHIRDQRPNMVTTKQQFEFVLMAVAEEVHAILKALPSQLQQQKEAAKEKEAA